MDKLEVVMLVALLTGHFALFMELAKLMLQKTDKLSISLLVTKAPFDPAGMAKIESLITSYKVNRLNFCNLPMPDISQWHFPHRGSYIN
ncbi:unnamed protein product [Coffea canephora]|uniref:Uncharacterized protein n=1 Tax=Coffea canephora TaxID=49390 RepID=A0A068UTK7_COFCA|nr:unnamed protein product [Coffea canephora]